MMEKFSNDIAGNYNSPADAAGKAVSMQSDGPSGKVIAGDCAVKRSFSSKSTSRRMKIFCGV
jgi:hypothetical protein